MASPLTWQFEIFDKISAPAKNMDKALTGVEKELGQVERATKDASKAQQRSKRDWGDWIIVAAQAADLLNRISGAIRGVAGGFYNLGLHILKTAAATENSALSFEIMMGRKGGADLLKWIDQVQFKTQFLAGDIRKLVQPLVTQGFELPDIKRLFAASADIATITNTGEAGAQRALEFFATIQATGRLQTRALKDLGLQEASILGSIGAEVGIRDIAKVRTALSNGVIPQAIVLENVLLGIEKAQKGALGSSAIRGSQTVTASLHKLSGAADNFFETLDQSPAFDKIRAALNHLVLFLDPSSQFGQRLQRIINEVFEWAFGGIADSGDSMERALSGVLDKVEKIWDTFRQQWPLIKETIAGILEDVVTLARALGSVAAAIRAVGNAGAAPTETRQIGGTAVPVGGIRQTKPLFPDEEVPGWLLNIRRSVQDLDQRLAGNTAANDLVMQIGAGGVKFAQKVDPGDVGVFSKAGGAFDRAADMNGIAAGAGALGGGIAIQIGDIYVNGPEEAGRVARESIERELVAYFDGAASQAGA